MVNQHPWQKQRETSVETMNNESDKKENDETNFNQKIEKFLVPCAIKNKSPWMNKSNGKLDRVPTDRWCVSDNSGTWRFLERKKSKVVVGEMARWADDGRRSCHMCLGIEIWKS